MDSEVRPGLMTKIESARGDIAAWRMERSETSAEGDNMESLGRGDGGYGVDYEFEQADKGSLGFVGADKVKELKRDVRKAWEAKGQGHFALTPTARQTGVLWAYGVQGKLVDKDKGVMFFFSCDPEVNHYTSDLRCDASMEEATSE